MPGLTHFLLATRARNPRESTDWIRHSFRWYAAVVYNSDSNSTRAGVEEVGAHTSLLTIIEFIFTSFPYGTFLLSQHPFTLLVIICISIAKDCSVDTQIKNHELECRVVSVQHWGILVPHELIRQNIFMKLGYACCFLSTDFRGAGCLLTGWSVSGSIYCKLKHCSVMNLDAS